MKHILPIILLFLGLITHANEDLRTNFPSSANEIRYRIVATDDKSESVYSDLSIGLKESSVDAKLLPTLSFGHLKILNTHF